ncbi:hypothetical protein E2C01_059524 [Portunus trituberculatus]|uniref:Uncharacterized protein n=1 Tax=Portunus trituberculatus TaxID=210409 RepID=A0A5B7GZE6_PORTR|nr:hypothetical protein [Portunus trituberculatus]
MTHLFTLLHHHRNRFPRPCSCSLGRLPARPLHTRLPLRLSSRSLVLLGPDLSALVKLRLFS